MRNVIELDPKWLLEIAPHYYKQSDIEDDEAGFSGLDGTAAAGDLPPAIPGLRRQLLLTRLP